MGDKACCRCHKQSNRSRFNPHRESGIRLTRLRACDISYRGLQNIALKSGESAELGDIYYISHDCKSLLKAAPEVEVLDGLLASLPRSKEERIVPRTFGCTKPVPGGKLIITANEVEEY